MCYIDMTRKKYNRIIPGGLSKFFVVVVVIKEK